MKINKKIWERLLYNKDLLKKVRKILLDRKCLYKNIDISLEEFLQLKKVIISNKQIEFKKIILTVGKFFNNDLIIDKKTLMKGIFHM